MYSVNGCTHVHVYYVHTGECDCVVMYMNIVYNITYISRYVNACMFSCTSCELVASRQVRRGILS